MRENHFSLNKFVLTSEGHRGRRTNQHSLSLVKLITFRIPPGLIKMYVLAAVLGRDVEVGSDLYENNTCNLADENGSPQDFSVSLIVMSVIMTLLGGPALVMFKCPYKRRNADKI